MPVTREQRKAAADPASSAEVLAQLAPIPELQLAIAANPATSDELLDWLVQYGGPEIRRALAEEALPPAPPPPPEEDEEDLPWELREDGPEGVPISARLGADEEERRRRNQLASEEQERIRADRAAAHEEQDIAFRAAEIKRWEAAWSLAHDGEAPPAGFMPPITVHAPANYGVRPTNGLAIAALVSVFFIAIVGLILGNIALGQIEKTDEGGRGLAVAAIVLGWIQLAVGALALLMLLVLRFPLLN